MEARRGSVARLRLPPNAEGSPTWHQADLPKQQLTELFNVNQFVISQVNPLPPSWCKAPAALLEDSPRSICPPGASQGSGRSYAPQRAA